MPLRTLVVAMASAVLLAAAASPAQADDTSVRAAWEGNDPQFAKLGRSLDRALENWKESDFRRWRPVVRVYTRIRRLLTKTRKATRAEQASTERGGEARKLALDSMRVFDQSLATFSRGVRRAVRGDRRATGDADRGVRLERRSLNLAKKAHRIFNELGVPRPAGAGGG